MPDNIEAIVANLTELEDADPVVELAERRLGDGDPAFVADLGTALHARYGTTGERMWQYRSVFGSLLQLLTTTPGRENIAQAVRLIIATGTRKQIRAAASQLASEQPPQLLAAVFAESAPSAEPMVELRACLVQELVLRGAEVAELPEVARWVSSVEWARHSLAWLPLSRLETEGEPGLPRYHARGASWPLPSGRAEAHGEPAVEPIAHVHAVKRTTTKSAVEAISAAVTNWSQESNGRIAAATFALAEPVTIDAVPGILAALDEECLDGLAPSAVAPCSAAQAWRLLFSAASTGGAYNNGLQGAYGRLAAWQSMTALTGAESGASATAAESRVQTCDWYSFGATTNWFEDVAWDIGLAVLEPQRRGLAVLAATDTD
ncbi:DUF6183 family protein [Streptomyces halobius]|uniref:DUF6183 family protein n=1 Tax=Streptomyces halobius TaxID=2879846 RepID=A0ABY4MMH3_9ACTN|nr:DUF6183 family protein [Streptomyces halobius]UQA97531.1 DUF6183 family protein [Streptomyces halobius]